MSTDELLAEALRLPRRERARVAEDLLSSLEEPADEVTVAWAEELERRSRNDGADLEPAPPVFVNLQDVRWEKFSPDQPDSDLSRIAFLRVDPKTQATQLLIKLPPDYYVPKHWHSANETHTILKGLWVFEHSGSDGNPHRVAQGPGSFNYLPARMIHRAWTRPGEEALVFISVDGKWDVTFVDDPETTPPRD